MTLSSDLADSSHALRRVSVIVPNYNYAAFVAAAIESALSLDWPDVEVIVVDDGSTDDSREVIARYADRVTVIDQPNGGQISAYNTGFARSSGDAVIFLDADDLLEPSLIREVSRVWRAGLSKVQLQMKIIDANGNPTGALLPQFHVVPSSADVKRWVMNAGTYPTPPGSGNVYSRRYLEQIFPLAGEDRAADSYCLAAAPHLGDVVTVAKPLVSYRMHGKNNGAMVQLDKRRFADDVRRAHARFEYARKLAGGRYLPRSRAALDRSLTVLPYRLASLALLPAEHPVPGDTTWKVLRDVALACVTPQGAPLRSRATLCAWSVSVALAPPPLKDKLALWRFASGSRPALLTHALRALNIVKAA